MRTSHTRSPRARPSSKASTSSATARTWPRTWRDGAGPSRRLGRRCGPADGGRIVPAALAVDAIPPGLAQALERRKAKLERGWWEGERSYLFAACPGGRLFGRGGRGPADAAVLEHEAAVREIVGAEGPLRAPPVLERGRGWLLETAIEPEPFGGAAHVELVVAAAERLRGLELPELPPRPGRGSFRA